MTTIRAWYVAPHDLRVPRTGELIRVGQTVRCAGPLVLCKHGLHASRDPLDAIGFRADGRTTLVELSGEVLEGDDKLCATERKTIAIVGANDGEAIARALACDVAEWAIGWSEQEPDQASVDAIVIARAYLRGDATLEDLCAARSAAGSVAGSAARSAAGDLLERLLLAHLGMETIDDEPRKRGAR